MLLCVAADDDDDADCVDADVRVVVVADMNVVEGRNGEDPVAWIVLRRFARGSSANVCICWRPTKTSG